MNSSFEALIERSFQRFSLRWALPVLAVVVYAIAWNRGIALLYGLFFLIMVVYGISWVMPRWNLSGISATRTHPHTAVEDEKVKLTIRIHAPGRRNRYMLSLHDRLPFADTISGRPVAYVARMRRWAEMDVMVDCALRGEYRLGPLAVRSGYPLGINNTEKILAGTISTLLVYPQWFAIRQLPILDRCRTPRTGLTDSPLKGQSTMVRGIREYCRGDSPRYIHWPTSAKHGNLMVKEFESNSIPHVLIVLDLHRRAQFGRGKHSTVEYSVKIAASIAAYALKNGHRVKAFGIGDRHYDSELGYGQAHFRRVLRLLARVKAEGTVDYPHVLHHALDTTPPDGLLVLFESGSDTKRLQLSDCPTLTVCFDTQSFDLQAASAGGHHSIGAHGVYHIACGDKLEQVFQ